MKIDIERTLAGERLQTAWELYEHQFAPMATLAVQRHLMTLPEFASVCADTAVQKWLGYTDDGTLIALATYTNNLHAMPLISPDYFEHRWPDEYARNAIWYCGFVCVDSDDPTTFTELITNMYNQAADVGGVIALDYCGQRARLATSVQLILRRVAYARQQTDGVAGPQVFRANRADHQEFWTYETAAKDNAS